MGASVMLKTLKTWLDRIDPFAGLDEPPAKLPPRERSPKQRAAQVRDLLKPGIWKWGAQYPSLEFDLEALEDGGLRLIARPYPSPGAAVLATPEQVYTCYRLEQGWTDLLAGLMAGVVEQAKKQGMLPEDAPVPELQAAWVISDSYGRRIELETK